MVGVFTHRNGQTLQIRVPPDPGLLLNISQRTEEVILSPHILSALLMVPFSLKEETSSTGFTVCTCVQVECLCSLICYTQSEREHCGVGCVTDDR